MNPQNMNTRNLVEYLLQETTDLLQETTGYESLLACIMSQMNRMDDIDPVARENFIHEMETLLHTVKDKNKDKPKTKLPLPEPNKEDTCSICITKCDVGVCIATICKHSFHKSCLKSWIQVNNECPNCRKYNPLDN